MSKTVSLRPISDEERHLAESFQELTKLAMEAFTGKVGRAQDLAKFKEFKRAVKKFRNYPFAAEISRIVDRIDADLKNTFKQGKPSVINRSTEEILRLGDALLKSAKSGVIDSATADRILQLSANVNTGKRKPEDVLSNHRNPLYLENPLIFQRVGFLQTFETSDMEALVRKDLDTFRYTYLPLPMKKIGDFTYMVHWIQQLRDSDEPFQLSNSEFSVYGKFAYDSDAFDAIESLAKQYLRGNDKVVVKKLLSEMKKIPDLWQANEAAKKRAAGTLYRGIPVTGEEENEYVSEPDEYDAEEMVKRDRREDFVAASSSFYAAKNFALSIGHLESERSRRSEYGVVLTYSVPPEAVILDTGIFGGIFGEREVLIDAKKSELLSFKVV